MLKDLQAKVANLEAKKLERQALRDRKVTPRRSDRDTKGRRRAEMRALTQDLMRRFDALESEQDHKVEGQNMDKGSTAAPMGTGGQKRKRMEAADCQDAEEGTSYGHEPFDEPSTSLQGAVEAPGTSGATYSEYEATHNTQGQSATWPWAGGLQQTFASPNPCTSPPMTSPGGFWPSINPHWFGWGMPYANATKTAPASEGKNLGAKQHHSVPDTGYNTVPIAALPYSDYSMPLGDHLTPAVKEKI